MLKLNVKFSWSEVEGKFNARYAMVKLRLKLSKNWVKVEFNAKAKLKANLKRKWKRKLSWDTVS